MANLFLEGRCVEPGLNGAACEYFPHDQARSRAYRWSFAVVLASRPPLLLPQLICARRTQAARVHDHHPGASRVVTSPVASVCQLSIDRQIHAGRVAVTIVGLRRANIRRDYSQADRIDLLAQVVAYRDHSGDGQLRKLVVSDSHIFC